MCELVLANTQIRAVNISLAYGLGFIDGIVNKDGTGFFSPGGKLWKTKFGATQLSNLMHALVTEVKTNNPILLHTRLATVGVGNVKHVSDNNSHPFQTERYIVAHNGTLTPKKGEIIGSMTDSEYFATMLNSTTEPDFVTSFNKTMEQFTGKFAFLIHDLLENKTYAIRGSTASLYWMPIFYKENCIGFCVNTNREDMIRGAVLGMNINTVMNKDLARYDFNIDKITEFSVNTIYDVTNLPKEVGKTKENFPATTYYQGSAVGWKTDGPTGYGSQKNLSNNGVIISPPGHALISYFNSLDITLEQLDFILLTTFGKGLLEMNKEELEYLDKEFTKEISLRVSKKSKELWKNILRYVVDKEAAMVYGSGIIFPYFLEDTKTLEYAANRLQQRRNEHANESYYQTAKSVFLPAER